MNQALHGHNIHHKTTLARDCSCSTQRSRIRFPSPSRLHKYRNSLMSTVTGTRSRHNVMINKTRVDRYHYAKIRDTYGATESSHLRQEIVCRTTDVLRSLSSSRQQHPPCYSKDRKNVFIKPVKDTPRESQATATATPCARKYPYNFRSKGITIKVCFGRPPLPSPPSPTAALAEQYNCSRQPYSHYVIWRATSPSPPPRPKSPLPPEQ